jgi:chorismate mutase/prephenate dehydratase
VDIDAIDAELVRLLNRRIELTMEVGLVKGRDQKPFFTPERERSIYEKLEATNPGPLQTRQLTSIFREIISAGRAAEKQLTCAFWGPAGTFTNMAALKTFGASAGYSPEDSIHDVFMAVEHGSADYGVVPVENSVQGSVPETLDMFPQTNVKICAETYVRIHHHLLSTAKSLRDVKRVYAGPQPAGQCRQWLRRELPNAEIVEMAPTAKAAQRAFEDPESAAIGNKLAAEIIGIPVLAERIEDDHQNRTRFLVVGYNEPAKTGRDKTSLMFKLKNEAGQLYKALGMFVEEEVNLMLIESRPAQRTTFEYIFYLDCLGHRTDEALIRAIARLKDYALETVILGSYPYLDPANIG